MRYANLALLLILAAFVMAALGQAVATRPFEGADEGQHLAYMLRLAQAGALPDRAASASNPTGQSSGQPPLYYAAGALLITVFPALAPPGGDVALQSQLKALENRWYSPPDRWNLTDNRNVYALNPLYSGDSVPSDEEIRVIFAFLLGRLTSIVFGLFGVMGMHTAARAVFRRQAWQLTATALFAFTPQYVQMSAIIHNDIAGVALAAWMTASALWIIRRVPSADRLLLLGVLIGLAGLAKINALAAAPGACAAVALAVWAKPGPGRAARLMRAGLRVAVPAALLLGPWLLWGLLTYSDPIGTATHYRPGYFYPEPLSLGAIIPLVPEVYLSYWGKLGSAVYLTPIVYTALGAVAALAALGYAVNWAGARAWLASNWRMAAALAITGLATAAALIHWLRTIHFITGRLAYAAHGPIILLITGGLALLAARARQRGLETSVRIAAAGVFLGAAWPASVHVLDAAFDPIDTRAALPAELISVPIDFAPAASADAAIRFLGYVPPAEPVQAGALARYTLCWQVLGSANGKPAAFSLKLFSQAGEQVADRTSLIGMGRYPSTDWRPGAQVCDAVDLPIAGTLVPGTVYNLLVVLLDAETLAVDWQARSPDGAPLAIPLIGTVAPSA